MDTNGFFGNLMDCLSNFFGSFEETIEVLGDSLDLPLRLSSYMPAIIGASITVVLFTMVIKFIIGR